MPRLAPRLGLRGVQRSELSEWARLLPRPPLTPQNPVWLPAAPSPPPHSLSSLLPSPLLPCSARPSREGRVARPSCCTCPCAQQPWHAGGIPDSPGCGSALPGPARRKAAGAGLCRQNEALACGRPASGGRTVTRVSPFPQPNTFPATLWPQQEPTRRPGPGRRCGLLTSEAPLLPGPPPSHLTEAVADNRDPEMARGGAGHLGPSGHPHGSGQPSPPPGGRPGLWPPHAPALRVAPAAPWTG